MKNKKDVIIGAATQLFAAQGFENTSVANICEVANVSKGLIYHHFKSKDEILKEIFDLTTQQMVEMSKSQSFDTAQNRLLTLIDTLFSQLESDKLFFQLNLNIMFQPSTKKLLSNQIKERSSLLLASIRTIFDDIDPSRSTVLSFIFIAEIDGVALDYLSVYEDYPLREIKEHLIAKYKGIVNG
ncbi:MAG: TetR/AcrR family transcriptional regulator [Cyclobacteriaceae bacterium]